MSNDGWTSWDDDDAYDPSSVDGQDSVLDEFAEYDQMDVLAPLDEQESEVSEFSVDAAGDDDGPALRTVSNPPGTVAVSVYLNGRIHRVDLAPQITSMSESELAEEIRVIADLAWRQARSECHEFAVEVSRRTGADPAAMAEEMAKAGFPAQADSEAMKARIFASRYYGGGLADRWE